jgi:hypothetical protein
LTRGDKEACWTLFLSQRRSLFSHWELPTFADANV